MMKRKNLVGLIGMVFIAGIIAGVVSPAPAADFPNQNIRIIVGAKPGGGMDLYARAVGRYMEKYLPEGVHVVVENRAGAGGQVGASMVYNSEPDGYTLNFPHMPGLYFPQMFLQKTKYDMTKVIWICLIGRDPRVIAISEKSKFKTLEDMKKADDAKFAIVGYTGEAGILLANAKLGIKATYITGHKNSKEAALAAVRGDADAVGFSYWSIRSFIKKGQLKPVAVLGYEERIGEIPDVPTLSELGQPEVNSILGSFRTICAPPGVPPERVKYLRDIFWKTLNDKELQEWAKKAKRPVNPMNGEAAEKLMKKMMSEYPKYKDILGKYIK
ncbi:MAG: tripartite tricarboxylate transporter substrate binding protein [Pseudomonadota bacterium]